MTPTFFTTILVGSDGSATAGEAIRRAADLARAAGGSVEVVGAAGSPKERDKLQTALDAAAQELVESGLDARAHVRDGDPVEVLLAAADELSADLIVVGNRGMTGARRYILGSVPDKVSHRATCSVLIANTA